jgi:aminopeptidase N
MWLACLAGIWLRLPRPAEPDIKCEPHRADKEESVEILVAPHPRSLVAVSAFLVIVSCTPGRDGGRPPGPDPSPAFEPSEQDLVGLGDPIVPTAGNPGYDVRHYSWDLEVDPSSNNLRAKASIRAVALQSMDRVTLDFSGPRVTGVRLNGETAAHARAQGKLIVEGPVVEADRFDIEVEYAGMPGPVPSSVGAERGWIAEPGAIRTVSVLPGDTAVWVPLNDTPLDPATYTLRITVPDPFVVTASGTLAESIEGPGTRTFVWEVALPVTEVTFVAGDYRTTRLTGPRGLPIDVAFPADTTAGDIPSLDQVPDMLAFLRARLGPFPFPSLGLTWVSLFGGGGDSTPGRINLSDFAEVVVVHELAHQWMGGSVGTASTRDAWLREGIPTYVEVLWTARRGGKEAARSMLEDFQSALGPTTRPPLEVDDPSDRSDDVTFFRGALVMHALKVEVGERGFFRALRVFFDRFRGTSASTSDFIETVEQVVDRDLTRFFDAWLSRGRVPKLPG